MRYYTYAIPVSEFGDPDYITMSEEEIRTEYFPYWYRMMCDKYGQAQVNENYCFEDCLDNWVILNSAWLVTE